MYQDYKRPIRPLTQIFSLAALLSCVFLLGCTNQNLAKLDREANRLVEERQRMVLGDNGGARLRQLPGRQDQPTKDELETAKQLAPSTNNPDAAELPARAMTKTESANEAKLQSIEASTQKKDELPGDDTKLIDLAASIKIALSKSREYQLRRENLYISSLEMLREQHLWGPRLFNTLSTNFSGPIADSSDIATANTVVEELRLTQRLPYGGEISARALARYVDEIRDDGSPEDSQSTSISIDLELPLLRGRGLVAQESLIQAKRNLVYEVREFEAFRRQFLVDISSEYFGLIQRQNGIANQEKQLENFNWLLERIAALAEAGREAPFEVQRVKQRVIFTQQDLEILKDSYANALDRYKIRLGLSPEANIQIVPVDIDIPAVYLDESSVEYALRYRLNLQTAKDRIDDAVRAVGNAKNNLLFDLDFTASLDLENDEDKDFGGVQFSGRDSSFSAGLRLEREFDQKRERIDYRRSILTLASRRRSYRELRDDITLQVRRSMRDLKQARITAAQQRSNVEIAKKRLRGVVLRLRSLGPRDFIEAQEDLIDAEQRRDSAQRDIRINVLRFLLNTGQMRVAKDGTWRAPAKMVAIEVDTQEHFIKETLKQGLTQSNQHSKKKVS